MHVACNLVGVGVPGSAASAPHVDMRVPPGQVAHELTDSGCPRVLSEMLSIIAASSRNTRTRSNQLPGSIAKPRVPLIMARPSLPHVRLRDAHDAVPRILSVNGVRVDREVLTPQRCLLEVVV